jgi:hypothetical protein
MPTISQLPPATRTNADDCIPITQGGLARSISIGTLLAATQPAILSDTSTLLGRISLGPGGPEQVDVGSGLAINQGTLVANASDHALLAVQPSLDLNSQFVIENAGAARLLPATALRTVFSAGANVSISPSGVISASGSGGAGGLTTPISTLPVTATIQAQDSLPVSQSGTVYAISYQNLLAGQTIDMAQPAGTPATGDTFWVSQDGVQLRRQTFAALWTWISGNLPLQRLSFVEITSNTTLSGASHNGRLLICSSPVTLLLESNAVGTGFSCEVVNLSGGQIALSGTFASNGVGSAIPAGGYATIYCLSYSQGTAMYVAIGQGGSSGALPGQVTGVTVTVTSSNSVSVQWSAPSAGGAVSSYTVQYRASGTGSWSVGATGVTGLAASVSALSAATSYDFNVSASNQSGTGPTSATVTVQTSPGAGGISSITWNVAPVGSYASGSGSIGVNAHVNPANAAVEFGFSSSATSPPTSWTAGVLVNSDLWGAYVPTPAAAGTWFAWVQGTDGSCSTVYSTSFVVT